MITIIKDILTVEKGLIFHQVNTDGVMGAGIAYDLANKFPGLERAYKIFIHSYEGIHETLGLCDIFMVNDSLGIVNIFGQSLDQPRYSKKKTKYDAVDRAFSLFNQNEAPKYPLLPCFFPYMMGCGLGGGNWAIYSRIIETHFPDAIICTKPGLSK